MMPCKSFKASKSVCCRSSGGSQDPSESETTLATPTPTPIVPNDVAQWVEPVGAGRRFDDARSVGKIGIIGTGDFGRALAGKMVQAGYKVSIGSRNPDRNRLVTFSYMKNLQYLQLL